MSGLLRHEDRRSDHRPWGLIVALVIAAAAGVLSLPLQILTFRDLGAATQQDVAENRRLVEQVRMLEQQNLQDVRRHRERNELIHADLCRLIIDIARSRSIDVQPCEEPLSPSQIVED